MHAQSRNDGQAALNCETNHSIAARNTAACTVVRAPRETGSGNSSGTDNSKRIDAAALALDLASASSWSDAFSPPAVSIHESINENLTGSQELEDLHNHIATEDTDLGPPPAYSSSYEHDLTVGSDDPEPENMRQPSPQREVTASTNLEHGAEESGYRDNPDAPLLSESSEKSPDGWYPWMQANSTASFRHHHSWRLYAFIGLVVVFIVGGVLGYSHVCSPFDG